MYNIKRVINFKVKGYNRYDELKREDVIFKTEDLNELLEACVRINYNLKLCDISELISGEAKNVCIYDRYIHESFYSNTNDFINVGYYAEKTE